jgi:hypothetical protein
MSVKIISSKKSTVSIWYPANSDEAGKSVKPVILVENIGAKDSLVDNSTIGID